MVQALTNPRPVLDDSLFDESAGYEDDRGIQVSVGLTDREKRQAAALYKLFNELMGLCVIRGEPGAGKDTFLNWILHTLKRYFPQKRTLRDERPRRLFGQYAGLFNEKVIQDDLRKMRAMAKGKASAEIEEDEDEEGARNKLDSGTYQNALENAADKWASGERAQALLHNSVLGMTEYWKYVPCREPHNPMNKTIGGINKMKRHLNILMFGCVQLESDLDKKTCKPFIDWRVTCTRSTKDTTRYLFIVEKVKYDARMDLLIPFGLKTNIPVDAGKPRSYLGDGRIVIKRSDYLPETDEEALVLDAIRAGVDKYEDLVVFLEEEGDMSEFETLAVLKELCLKLPQRKPKFAINYPCTYHTFNSRSAPNLVSRVKVGDD